MRTRLAVALFALAAALCACTDQSGPQRTGALPPAPAAAQAHKPLDNGQGLPPG